MENSRSNEIDLTINGHVNGDMNMPKLSSVSIDNVDIPEIVWGDIEEEVNYWEPSILCFVLSANPPQHVIDGFLRRIWGKRGIDKIVSIGNGIFMVRFGSMEVRDTILSEEYQFFDGKPLVTQAWEPDVD